MNMQRLLDNLAAIPLLLLAFAFFSPMLDGGFLTDDFHNIRFAVYGPEGKSSFDPDDPTAVLAYFHKPATERYELYRPLVPLSFRLSYEFFGTEARHYILTNVLLHLLGALLAMNLVRSLFPRVSRVGLLFALALFAFSPLQVQVAYWSSARSDSLSWIWGALALLVKWSDKRRWVLPLSFAMLSMCSKESGIVFLALVGFCDLTPARNSQPCSLQSRLFRFGGSMLCLAAYLGLRKITFGDLTGDNSYGSINVADTLRLHGWENLSSGFLTALAPATDFVIPNATTRMILKALLGLGTTWVFVGGFLTLRKQGFERVFIVTALLVLPFVMASLVSKLDARFINTRGCYIPLFSVSALLALALAKRTQWRYVGAVVLIAASLCVSWPLRNLYIEAGAGTHQVLQSMRSPLKELPPKKGLKLSILNYQHLSWFQGGFSVAGCLRPALMRPFLASDFQTDLVKYDREDPVLKFLTPFDRAMSRFGDSTVMGMRRGDEDQYVCELLHRDQSEPGPQFLDIEAVQPAAGFRQILQPKDPSSLAPRFIIRHSSPEASRYDIALFNPRSRLVKTRATVAKIHEEAEGYVRIELVLKPLSVQQAREFDQPKQIAWCVYAQDKKGAIVGQSQLTVYTVKTDEP